jgi:glycosyltransferase involved in cell wall biosynthesis
MRILILVRILTTQGRPKLAIAEARELMSMGHMVELVFLRKSEKMAGYYDLLKGINCTIINETNHSLLVPLYDYITGLQAPDRRGDLRVDYNFIRDFPKYARERNPDLLICHDSFAGISGYHAFKRYGIRYVVYIDERVEKRSGIIGYIMDRYERKVLRHASRVFAITQKVADSIKRRYNVESFVNLQGFGKYSYTNYTEKENIIISVSAWDSGRRPMKYIEVIAEIPDYKLLMVGNWRDQSLKEEFMNEIVRRGIQDRVEVHSGIDEIHLSNLYNSSKFAMRFGFGEYGSPSGLTEAIGYGLPIISNEDIGISDLIRQNRVGLVLNNINGKDVSAWIKSVDNEKEYENLQRNCIDLTTRYSWKSHAEKFISVD